MTGSHRVLCRIARLHEAHYDQQASLRKIVRHA
jgi:hypothetical protein